MTERRLWILIAVLLVAIALVIAKRRWSPINPHAAEEIEKAKQR